MPEITLSKAAHKSRFGKIEFTPRALFLELISGLVVSTIATAYAVGFSALIFDGPIRAGLATGL